MFRPVDEHTRAKNGRFGQLAWICLLAIALHLPSLSIGFLADDYVHQWRIESGDSALRTDLYNFSAARNAARAGSGEALEAWWMSPEWELTFVRPLTSLSISLDHLLFGRTALASHIENLAWLVLCLLAMARVLGDLGLSKQTVGLALVIFAASDVTLVPVGWIANRNSLLEVALGLSAIAVLGRKPTGLRLGLALLLALGASAAKESGSLFLALTGALAFRRGQVWVPAWTALAGGALVSLWKFGGLQSQSRFYPSPFTDLGEYLTRLTGLVAALPSALALPLPTDLYFQQGRPGLWIVLVGPVLFGCFAPLLAQARRSNPRAFGFFAGWTLLALLPQACAPLSDRLYFHALAPAAALLAMSLQPDAARQAFPIRRRIGLALTVFVSGAALFAGQVMLAKLAEESRQFVASALDLADEAGAKTVVLTQAPNPLAFLAPGAVAAMYADREDVAFVQLQLYGRELRIESPEVSPARVQVFSGVPIGEAPVEIVLRAPGPGPAPGHSARRGEITLTVLETGPQEPAGAQAIPGPIQTLEIGWEGPAPLFLGAGPGGPRPLEALEGGLFGPQYRSWLPLELPGTHK